MLKSIKSLPKGGKVACKHFVTKLLSVGKGQEQSFGYFQKSEKPPWPIQNQECAVGGQKWMESSPSPFELAFHKCTKKIIKFWGV